MINCFQVSRKNLMDIVRKLMVHMDKSEGSHYRDELLSKIIEICSQNDYQHITHFEWLAFFFFFFCFVKYFF
jgi:AP-3 complex subunit delta-1